MSKTYKLNACKRVKCKGTVEILENVCLNFSIGFNKNLSFRLQNVVRLKKTSPVCWHVVSSPISYFVLLLSAGSVHFLLQGMLGCSSITDC